MISPKMRRYAYRWWKSWGRLAGNPIRGLLFAAVQTPIYFYLIYSSFGVEILGEEVGVEVAALSAVGAAYILYLFGCGFAALFLAKKHDLEIGRWYGNEYVYESPLLLKTARVTPEENGQPISVKIIDTPKRVYISYLIEVENAVHRVEEAILGHPLAGLRNEFPNGKTTGSFGIENRKTNLYVRLKPNTDPVTLRVYLRSWNQGE